jgi:uracil-DNA glycosylase
MSKKVINQKANYSAEMLNSIEPNFTFQSKPINRTNKNTYIHKKNDIKDNKNKEDQLAILKKQISSIKDCKLKNNSKKIILGDGDINSPIMLIGEAPGADEDELGQTFAGEVGNLLEKMLYAINIKKNKIYTSYAVNFRPPDDRKPSSSEIRRYSQFLQKHISIISPKIIILMGATAMESLTGLTTQISRERGKWKEVIIFNKSYDVIITFNPSYLLRVPENKKYSWEDLKEIKKRIDKIDFNIK